MSDNKGHNKLLAGHVALITGASKGIGLAIAERLACEGIHLVLAARSEGPLKILAESIQAKHPEIKVMTVVGDVSKNSDAKKIVVATLEAFHHIDILINNAGVAGKIALLQEILEDDIHRIIDTNLKGAIFMMQQVLPSMAARRYGTIVNINSVAGKEAYPYWSVYDASKFGLKAITQAVAEEQRSNNIKIVGIYPGAVDTPIWETIEMDHEPSKEGMLDAETVAETVVHILRQPGKVFITEVTLTPLQPAL